MRTLLLLAAGTIVALTLPLLLELTLITGATLFLRRRLVRPVCGDWDGVLAVVIPAHEEELLIGRTVESVRAACLAAEAAGSANIRVVVIAHNCTDSTGAQARDAGAEVTVLDTPGMQGKGAALAFAFAAVRADAFLVIDADSVVDAGLVAAVVTAFASGAEAIQCRYEALPGPSSHDRMTAVAFRGMNVLRPSGRARLGLSAGILGNGFGVRKSLLARVPYDAHSVVEDLEFHLALVRAGVKVWYLQDAVIRSKIAGTRSQHARWEGGRMRMIRLRLVGLVGDVMEGRLASVEPMLDLAGLPIAQAVMLLLIGLAVPVWSLRWYSGIGLWIVAMHVSASLMAGEDLVGEAGALLLAPLYLLRKLINVAATGKASKAGAAWIRTERGGESKDVSGGTG